MMHGEYQIVVEDEEDEWFHNINDSNSNDNTNGNCNTYNERNAVEYESMNDAISRGRQRLNINSNNNDDHPSALIKYDMKENIKHNHHHHTSMLDNADGVNSTVSGSTMTTTSTTSYDVDGCGTNSIEDAYNYTHDSSDQGAMVEGGGVEGRVPLLLSYDAENSARYWKYGAQHSRQGNSQAYFYGHEYEQDLSSVGQARIIVSGRTESIHNDHTHGLDNDNEYDAHKHFEARYCYPSKQNNRPDASVIAPPPTLITTDNKQSVQTTPLNTPQRCSYYRRFDDTLCLPPAVALANNDKGKNTTATITKNTDDMTMDSSSGTLPSRDNTSRSASIRADESTMCSEYHSSMQSSSDHNRTNLKKSEQQRSSSSSSLNKNNKKSLSSPTMSYLKRKQQKNKINDNDDSNTNPLLACIDIFEQIETSCSGIGNSTVITPMSSLASDDDNNENSNISVSLHHLRDIVFNYVFSKS